MKRLRRFIYWGSLPTLATGVLIYGSNLYFGQEDQAIVLFHPFGPRATYSDILQRKGKTTVNGQTSNDSMKNILLSRMFPNYKSNHSYSENQLFTGSPKITLKGKNHWSSNTKLFVMERNDDSDLTKLRNACVAALSKTAEPSKKEIYRLREWCTVPQVKDVLKRHKFKLASTNDHWKAIVNSDWFKKENIENQSFLGQNQLKDWDSKSEEDKISLIKERCRAALSTPFERTNFPAPRIFLRDQNKNADQFQEAAFFCVEPKTARDYVNEAMKGDLATTLPHYMKGDFCYVRGKDRVSDYEDVKTTDPMGGRSFWCAVRMIYGRYKASGA